MKFIFALLFSVSAFGAVQKIPGTMLGTGAVASQGATGKVDVQSVFFGSGTNCSGVCSSNPCLVCSPTGGKITSVTRVGPGQYDLNGIDGFKYNCYGSSENTIYAGVVHKKSLSSTTAVRVYTGNTSAADSANISVTCTGIP